MITKPIYEPRGKAREYGELALNIYDGCSHRCIYCYARKMAERYTAKDSICNFDNPKPRPGIVESVKKQMSTGKIKGRTIHLCFSCDPYPADIDTTATREIIKIIKDSGNHVQILTKGGSRAERDFDLLDDGDWFGVTVTEYEGKCYKFEPDAAGTADRLGSLVKAKDMGIKTWVSFEPVLNPNLVFEWIEFVKCIDLFKIGKLNYMPSTIDWAEFGRKCERICRAFNRDYYIKADLRVMMEQGAQL